MEKKENMGVSVKGEDVVDSSSYLVNSYNQFSSVFDFCEVEKSSLGFMELLGVQNYSPLLDLPQLSTMSVMTHDTLKAPSADTGKEYSEVLNQQPATPNSCSISSASSEALNDEHNKTLLDQHEDEEDEKQKINKQWVFLFIFLFLLFRCCVNVFILKTIFIFYF